MIGLGVLLLRQWIPESPRWLMTHGDPEQASRVVSEIEQRVEAETGQPLPPVTDPGLRLRRHAGDWVWASLRVMFAQYRQRTVVGVVLMASQAFCYNAVFFTYALVLTKFYGVAGASVGWYILPFAAGNLLGAAAAGAVVRQPRSPGHDRRDVRAVGRVAGGFRMGVR